MVEPNQLTQESVSQAQPKQDLQPQSEHEGATVMCLGENDDADIKVIILGDSAVGKSKLIERFLDEQYNPQRLSTHALTLFRKDVKLGDGTTVKADFWDTAGQERFSNLHASYYYQADACILVFDVTRKQTYLNLKKWYKDLREHCEGIPCILVANKVDIDYSVTRKKFKFAGQNNLPFFFVSSADGTNVVKVFEEAVCAGLGHQKFGGTDFISECLDLFQDSLFQEQSISSNPNPIL